MDRLTQGVGLTLVAMVLLDIFLTVLYARGGAGLFTPVVHRAGWSLFKGLARLLPSRQGFVLSLAGPSLIAATVIVWVAALVIGFGLVAWPELGVGVTASHGETSPSFVTALYYSGYSLSTVGLGDLAPTTPFMRAMLVFEGLVGFSVISLSLTYFVTVFSALGQRNSIALHLHGATAECGEAERFLAALGAGGELGESVRTELSTLASKMAWLLQSHHAYPTLHYFRWPSPEYAMARVCLVVLETAALATTALHPQRYAGFVNSGAVDSLQRLGLRLVNETTEEIIPRRTRSVDHGEQARQEAAWRARYHASLPRLRDAGLETHPDPDAGASAYVELRRRWDAQVHALAHYMAYDWPQIAPRDSAEPPPKDAPL